MRIKTKTILLPVLVAVAVSVLLGGCKKQTPSVQEEPTAEVITEVLTEPETETTTEEETTEAQITEQAEVEPEKEEEIPTYDSHFAKQIEGRIEADMMILNMTEQDFNGDGKTESFAVVVEKKKPGASSTDSRKVEYWFYSDKVSKRLWSSEVTMDMKFSIENVQLDSSGKHIGCICAVGPFIGDGNDSNYIYSTYAVNRSGEPVLLLKSNATPEYLVNDCLQLVVEYIGYSQQTWFTFDYRKCSVTECKNIQISEDDFCRLQGGEDILNAIRKDNKRIEAIYYCKPGIVSVSAQHISENPFYDFYSYIVGRRGVLGAEPVAESGGYSPVTVGNIYNDAQGDERRRPWNDEIESFAIVDGKTPKYPY